MSAVWYCSHYLPKVLLTPAVPVAKFSTVVYLELWISPRIFAKIQNDPNVIFSGLGEDDSRKKSEAKILWHCPFFKAFFFHLPANFFTILSWAFHLQFSFHDRVWRLTRGSTIPTSRSLRANTAHSGSDTPAPFSFTSECTQVSEWIVLYHSALWCIYRYQSPDYITFLINIRWGESSVADPYPDPHHIKR